MPFLKKQITFFIHLEKSKIDHFLAGEVVEK